MLLAVRRRRCTAPFHCTCVYRGAPIAIVVGNWPSNCGIVIFQQQQQLVVQLVLTSSS